MSSQCKIYLENYSGTYYPGSEIRGRLECYFDDQTSIRGIKVRLKCKEYNEWLSTESYTDPVDHKTKTRTISLTGDRNVLFVEQLMLGSGSGSREVGRGRHVYPFSFTLPYDIPSTFKGPHGYISYKIKGVVDRPMAFDYEDNFIFVVNSPIDFNRMPEHHQDIMTYSDEKTVCCWCCKGGNISLDVELPKTAFVPGETVNCKATVTNLSNSNVENLKVKFTKVIKYRVTSPNSESKEDTENILSFTEHGVGAHGEHTYNLQLAIPQYLDVPNFTKCHLFKVSYFLEVTCDMPACTVNLDIKINDIELGHIPFTGYIEGNTATPGFVNPSADGNFPMPQSVTPFPLSPGNYPPAAGNYPATNGNYPPPADGAYPPLAGGGYPPPASGGYPPAAGANYPQYPPGGNYPSPSGNVYPPPTSGAFGPPAYPANYSEKPVYPGGVPSAPGSSIANAPPFYDNPKAREAANSGPSVPTGPQSPPPSYSQIAPRNAPYSS